MNGTAARFVRLGVSLAGLVTLGWVLTGQAAKPAKHAMSLPTDWSHRHVIFSRPGSAEQLARVSEDPRYWQQIYRREQARVLPAADTASFESAWGRHAKKFRRDWAVSLGAGASAGADNYPAKFSFDLTTADCTADYVVYSTGLAGSLTQADIVGFNNLYSGCGGTVPTANWAYNTLGTVMTSPVLSADGTQVAFVETNGGFGILVLLKWAAGTGSISLPATPLLVVPALYQACVAPCMTQILLRDNVNAQTDDTTSSVFYDYTNDIAWVGGARGWLHKVTGAFKGTPAEVTTGGFPAQVNNTTWTSSPVYDRISNQVFVGDASGFLYRVDAATGAVTASGQLDFGAGVVEGPLLDVGNGWVYVFASSDGSATCGFGAACSAVYQLGTTFGATTTGTKITIGRSVVFGSLPNPNPTYLGGFDSAYYNSGTATGNLYVCGNTGKNATLYQIPVVAGVPSVSTLIAPLATGASTAACSPVSDLPNPNTAGGPSERIFVSVQDNGVAAACATGGCIFNFVVTPWKASTAYAVGQQVFDSKLHVETVITAGTSGATAPAWTTSAAALTPDGSVTWIDGGVLKALTSSWIASHFYGSVTNQIVDSNGNVQVSTTTGTSGTSAPAWNTTPGGTTPDGPDTLVWTNAGHVGTFALPVAGGTSGIIEDNTVSVGTLAGGSQVYFTTLADQLCATSATTGGCAVQASQPALQ